MARSSPAGGVVVNESGERRKEGSDKRASERVRFVFISSLGGNERGQERAIYMHMQPPTDRPTDGDRLIAGQHVTRVAEREKERQLALTLIFSVAMKCAVIPTSDIPIRKFTIAYRCARHACMFARVRAVEWPRRNGRGTTRPWWQN